MNEKTINRSLFHAKGRTKTKSNDPERAITSSVKSGVVKGLIDQQKPALTSDSPLKRHTTKVGKKPYLGLRNGTPSCNMCSKSVYLMELIAWDGVSYHKNCFRCLECKNIVQPKGVAMMSGDLFCKGCFKKKFKTRGRYDDITSIVPGTQSQARNLKPEKQPKAAVLRKKTYEGTAVPITGEELTSKNVRDKLKENTCLKNGQSNTHNEESMNLDMAVDSIENEGSVRDIKSANSFLHLEGKTSKRFTESKKVHKFASERSWTSGNPVDENKRGIMQGEINNTSAPLHLSDAPSQNIEASNEVTAMKTINKNEHSNFELEDQVYQVRVTSDLAATVRENSEQINGPNHSRRTKFVNILSQLEEKTSSSIRNEFERVKGKIKYANNDVALYSTDVLPRSTKKWQKQKILEIPVRRKKNNVVPDRISLKTSESNFASSGDALRITPSRSKLEINNKVSLSETNTSIKNNSIDRDNDSIKLAAASVVLPRNTFLTSDEQIQNFSFEFPPEGKDLNQKKEKPMPKRKIPIAKPNPKKSLMQDDRPSSSRSSFQLSCSLLSYAVRNPARPPLEALSGKYFTAWMLLQLTLGNLILIRHFRFAGW
eukprot:CAMPEP_0184481862 /NCGR_PEP_ID=MMETSP0113_2-20130426/3450_1 /TAXON_ID=91329 /ORGANISM="Norrisiella sphaerica, Strain BC52" /LENGTH=598 /DNA_ID=CAMNT_0026861273 /DNA_START=489 /DNA_END=2282 /DNA_ORIENTATION=-